MTNKPLVSIDIFDTAIYRDVWEPRDIFRLIDNQIGRDFYNKRVEAEHKCYCEGRFRIKDFYRLLPEFDMQYEIDMELKHCYANQKILDMYNNGQADYIFISDMYLPNEVLVQMLEKCGYKNPKVFVSCEFAGLGKREGKLFRRVQKILGRKIERHYGDNYKADVEGAKAIGIKPCYTPSLNNKPLLLPEVKDGMLRKYIAEIENKDIDVVDKLAMWYAPIMLAFTKWVLAERGAGNENIYFVSRDMYVPYFIAKRFYNAKNIYYLHASRRSIAPIAMNGDDMKLYKRLKLIYDPREIPKIIKQDRQPAYDYFRKMGIKNGDYFVDIGYAGTVQYSLEHALGIKLKGLYMQTCEDNMGGMNMKMYLSRIAIIFCLLVETPFCSPEHQIEGYKDGKPTFKKDTLVRRQLSARLFHTMMKVIPELIEKNINLTVFDIEQILIHLQYYPSNEMMELYNRPIYSNRSQHERIINFDKEAIMQGRIKECFDLSYCQHLLRIMIERDGEFKHLLNMV